MKTKNLLLFFSGAIAAISLLVILGFDKNQKEISNSSVSDTIKNQRFIPKIPAAISFAGEKVPLEKWEIREQFDREFTLIYYQTGGIFTIMKYANRWFPLITERLKHHGVPDDFKYLCVAESNVQNLISRAGAVGFWQFMSYTGPGFGLEINGNVDERYNVLKSTDAACAYLKQAYNKFGSWTAAAASYNCGQGKYNEQATLQRTRNYYDLQLPEETLHYIYRILSFKHLLENSRSLGYVTETSDLYAPHQTRTVTVSSIGSLTDFAINNGTTYRMLKILNPWLRGRSLPPKGGKTYTIHLPEQQN